MTALLPVAAAQAPQPVAKPAGDVTVVMLSDLHLDPFYDPAKFARLRASGADAWGAIFAEPDSATLAADAAKLNAACPMRGADSRPALVRSSLQAARAAAPNALFAVVSGDLMAHQFDCRFKALAPQSSDADYSAFAYKTAAFVALELRQTFGATPVFVALGNNDSGCGDYRESSGSAFLRALAASLAGQITLGPAGASAARTGMQQRFATDGSYSVPLPAPIMRGRLIVLQDLFQSHGYRTCSGQPDATAPAEQVKWLRAQLEAAHAAHEQVWVMAHIPPGVDVYSTVRAKGDICAGKAPSMFLANDELNEALTDFGGDVRLALFGHTHNDEIHLLQPASGGSEARPGARNVAAKLVPSVSPINGNVPAFTIAQVDPRTATLEDYRVLMASDSTGVGTKWTEEYDFSKTYGVHGYTAETVGKLVGGFIADKAGAAQASTDYAQNFFPGGGKGTLAVHLVWPQYACALANHTAESYRECVCAAK